MASVNNNEIVFESDDSSIDDISFTFSGQFMVSEGQPFEGVTESGNNTKKLTITAKCGNVNTVPPADWFCEKVNNVGSKMIHTEGGDFRPQELNFAFTGKLNIQGVDFEICLGQGRYPYSTRSNWFLNSEGMLAASNNKSGTLKRREWSCTLSQDGSHTFKIKIA